MWENKSNSTRSRYYSTIESYKKDKPRAEDAPSPRLSVTLKFRRDKSARQVRALINPQSGLVEPAIFALIFGRSLPRTITISNLGQFLTTESPMYFGNNGQNPTDIQKSLWGTTPSVAPSGGAETQEV